MSVLWWDVKPSDDGKMIVLIPHGPEYADPRDYDKPIATFNPVTAVEVGTLLLRTAQLMTKDFTTEK